MSKTERHTIKQIIKLGNTSDYQMIFENDTSLIFDGQYSMPMIQSGQKKIVKIKDLSKGSIIEIKRLDGDK